MPSCELLTDFIFAPVDDGHYRIRPAYKLVSQLILCAVRGDALADIFSGFRNDVRNDGQSFLKEHCFLPQNGRVGNLVFRYSGS